MNEYVFRPVKGKVAELSSEYAETRADPPENAQLATANSAIRGCDNMQMIRKEGRDCLSLVVDQCHKGGAGVCRSHRINDVHDSILQWDYLLSQKTS